MNARESGANDCKVGCYYFPGYHADPRNDVVHGRGWTEWSLVKAATPRFRGHRQPLVPQWGYEDEASVRAMERKIAAAADHGIDCFIFDWYWYEGPFLQRPLDEAFMIGLICTPPRRGLQGPCVSPACSPWMPGAPSMTG
jgi:hypothetical protein